MGAERSRIHTFIATSDLHLAKKLNITREQCLTSAVAAVKQWDFAPGGGRGKVRLDFAL